MRIGQQVVTGGQKYSFPMPNANNNLVVFDIHNDSPYNVGVSLGTDTGINNCDYYTTPHGAIFGVSPFGASRKSIGGSRWNGTIFVYTEVPAGGGGTTNLANAPASSVTVLGYPQGYQPQAQIALNRMQTTANTVATSGNVATTSIVNDGNAAATQWVEATQSGGPASNVVGTVDGSIQFNQWDGATKKLLFQTIANAGANNPSIKLLTAGLIAEFLGTILIDNNIQIQYKDNGGTARKVFQVDNNNNTQLYGISGLDLIQFLSSGNTVQMIFDLVNGILNITGKSQSVNGDTSGTMTTYEAITGNNLKILQIAQNNYRQAGATGKNIVLKNAFTTFFTIIGWGCGGVNFRTGGAGGTAQNLVLGNGALSTSGAAIGNATQFQGVNIGGFFGPFDTITDNGSYASAHTGAIVVFGI